MLHQALCKGWVNIAMNKMDTVLAFSVYKPLLVFMNCLLKSLVCFSAEEKRSLFLSVYINISYSKNSNTVINKNSNKI